MGPKILISADREKPYPVDYMIALWIAGARHAVPIYAPSPAMVLTYDGLLLSGGDDVNPACYDEENTASEGIDPKRDAAELALVGAFLRAGKPIFGICRGQQLLNVAFGGTLIQDLPEGIRQPSDTYHKTKALPGTLIARYFGEEMCTNHYHHQAVDRVGKGLRATQYSKDGAVIEALEHESLPIFSVQWHPERMTGNWTGRQEGVPDSRVLFAYFVRLCEARHA